MTRIPAAKIFRATGRKISPQKEIEFWLEQLLKRGHKMPELLPDSERGKYCQLFADFSQIGSYRHLFLKNFENNLTIHCSMSTLWFFISHKD